MGLLAPVGSTCRLRIPPNMFPLHELAAVSADSASAALAALAFASQHAETSLLLTGFVEFLRFCFFPWREIEEIPCQLLIRPHSCLKERYPFAYIVCKCQKYLL